MPYITLEDQTRLYYETHGSGTPILFIHGVLMSGQFFHKQFSALSANYQCIRLDLRGHGESDKVLHGHTISQYARDIREFLNVMELDHVVLAGWSMGAFVVWDYLNQFGNDNIQAAVIIDQSASDYQWEGWEHGPFDFNGLKTAMHAIQTDPLPFYEASSRICSQNRLPRPKQNGCWQKSSNSRLPFLARFYLTKRPLITGAPSKTSMCRHCCASGKTRNFSLQQLENTCAAIFQTRHSLPFLKAAIARF